MSLRFILVLILTGISVTIFFFFMGNKFNYSDTSDLILTNLLYQNDYILYFGYLLFRFKPFSNLQSFLLLIIYFVFLCIGISGAFIFDAGVLNTIYLFCEGLVRLMFVFYFIKYLKIDIKNSTPYFIVGLITTVSSFGFICYFYEEIKLIKLVSMIVFYSIIILYLLVGNGINTTKARNKVLISFGLFFTFISDFCTLININFNVEVYMFTLLRLVSVIGEFLVIYVILEELKSKTKYKPSIKH